MTNFKRIIESSQQRLGNKLVIADYNVIAIKSLEQYFIFCCTTFLIAVCSYVNYWVNFKRKDHMEYLLM